MAEIKRTRDLFLWCMSAVYMFAFGSFYYQIPGLYGDNGILPVKQILQPSKKTITELISEKPTLVWLAPLFGLDAQSMLELVSIGGIFLAFIGLLTRVYRDTTTFAVLWFLYLSCYSVGQTFLWFQWDILLLEAGFLAIIVAPLFPYKQTGERSHDKISMWLVRWLLFRFMFTSGVVKLTSHCPTWWGLTALNYHFETQCIPHPLSWYAHQLPEWFLKLGVVGTFVIEIAMPFLFLQPIRSLRIFSFWMQILLQVAILLTGNYNFFNILTIAMCISLLDDDYLNSFSSKPQQGNSEYPTTTATTESATLSNGGIINRVSERAKKLINKPAVRKAYWGGLLILECLIIGSLAYWTVVLFSLKFQSSPFTIESNINFSKEAFATKLDSLIVGGMWLGIASLGFTIFEAVYRSAVLEKHAVKKVFSTFSSLMFGAIALWMFGISMVPYTVPSRNLNRQVWPVLQNWYEQTSKFELVNSYGLFRRMTGVEGRPEIIIEGSNSLQGDWKEYNFLYKPGDVSKITPFLVPHQPRLDWQMWFAALSEYNQNPWFLRFVYLLLENQKEVLDLMGPNPFPKAAPKYIRATSYTYRYTQWNATAKHKVKDWWIRKKVGEYIPSTDKPTMTDYLTKSGLLYKKSTPHFTVTNKVLVKFLGFIRYYATQFRAPVFLWGLLATEFSVKIASILFS